MRWPVLAVLCAVVVTAPACGAAEKHEPLPPNTKSAFGSQEKPGTKEAAEGGATRLAGAYVQATSQLDNNVAKSVDDAASVAAGPALATMRNDVLVRRSRGIVTTGEMVVVSTKILDIRIDAKPARAAVSVCIDTSKRVSKFPNGDSANAPNRMDRGKILLTMENPAWPDNNSWRVTVDSSLRDRSRQKCDG